jgi:branched-chain amino acid transport system ATP-binding protein
MSRPTAPLVECGAPVLAAEDVTVRFSGVTAISSASIVIRQGNISGLIGPNGAGKTTLVNCLTGYQRPTDGRVRLGDASATEWRPDRFRQNGVARTFQSGRLFRGMSTIENVEVVAVALGMSRRDARRSAMEILDWIGLADKSDAVAGTLAYTDERRLAIARALVNSPRFLLLDEPAAGMSDAECDDLIRQIRRISTDFNCGVLLIEHNMGVVMKLSDRIYVLNGGSLIAEGEPEAIQSDASVIEAYLGTAP